MTFPRRVLPLALSLLLGLAACGVDEYDPGHAQPGPAAPEVSVPVADESDTTAVDLSTSVEYDAATDEVRVFARVEDQNGDPLFDLGPENFAVILNPGTAPRPVARDDLTIDIASSEASVVALVIDSSGSMSAVTETGQTRMQVAKEAAKLFVGLMGPDDLVAIVDFDDEARILQQLTNDQTALEETIDGFTASGATNLGGALIEAVRAVGTRPGRRAVVFLTDGDDTVDSVTGGPDVWMQDPTSTRYQGLQLAKERDLVVFTVGLGGDLSDIGKADLQTFAEETGGQFFEAVTAASLLTAFGVTIPQRIEALDPIDTLELTFPNPFSLTGTLTSLDVPFVTNVTYANRNGTLRAVFSGTYTVTRP